MSEPVSHATFISHLFLVPPEHVLTCPLCTARPSKVSHRRYSQPVRSRPQGGGGEGGGAINAGICETLYQRLLTYHNIVIYAIVVLIEPA